MPKVKANSKRIGFKPSGRKPGRRTDFTNDPAVIARRSRRFPALMRRNISCIHGFIVNAKGCPSPAPICAYNPDQPVRSGLILLRTSDILTLPHGGHFNLAATSNGVAKANRFTKADFSELRQAIGIVRVLLSPA